MINSEELLFVVDENNNPLKPLQRKFAHENGIWHRTTGIWVINNKGQILCQKRSMRKDTNPGLWEPSFGGHLGPNETYDDNALKELSEELGITPQKEQLILYKIIPTDLKNHKKFEALYAYKLDRDDTNFNVEKEEVDEIKWIDREDVKRVLIHEPNSHWIHYPWDKEGLQWLTTL